MISSRSRGQRTGALFWAGLRAHLRSMCLRPLSPVLSIVEQHRLKLYVPARGNLWNWQSKNCFRISSLARGEIREFDATSSQARPLRIFVVCKSVTPAWQMRPQTSLAYELPKNDFYYASRTAALKFNICARTRTLVHAGLSRSCEREFLRGVLTRECCADAPTFRTYANFCSSCNFAPVLSRSSLA